MKSATLAIGAAILATFAVLPAHAQKSKDTFRVALHQPIRQVDTFYNPNPESNLMDRAVMDTLLSFDVSARALRPQLAESWRMIDGRTVELKLHRNVKFHNGAPFDADDVIYTYSFATDPKSTFLFRDSRFGHVESFEKLDQYTVRVRAKSARAPFLTRLVQAPPILPSKVHAKLENKAEFGRSPVGTGPYRVASLDNNMVVMTKNADYNWGGGEPAGKIGRLEIASIADSQTQIAKLMTGELDLVFDLDLEQANSLRALPNIKISVTPTVSFTYIYLDAADRSGIKIFKDKRLREAVLMAIDRDAIRKAFLPTDFAAKSVQDAMCHPLNIGCAWSEKAVGYDPAQAKKLLAEAGYADGFDLEILTWGQSRPVAVAIAGDLRKIGIRATVDAVTVNVFQSKRGDGKAQSMVTSWDNGDGQPDVNTTTDFFFADSNRNYSGDADLISWTEEGVAELDLKKREDIYRKLFDKIIRERYGVPVMELPAILAHDKDLLIDANHSKAQGFMLNRIAWNR